MKYAGVDFTNVGPIEEGTIRRDMLSVFIGPNNSGKTIAAKIIHGICQMDEGQGRRRAPAGAGAPPGAAGARTLASAIAAATLIRHAGLQPDAIPAQGKKASAVSVHGFDGSRRDFDLASARGNHLAYGMSLATSTDSACIRRSMYLPAARAGGTQHFLGSIRTLAKMARMQSRLLGQMLSVAASGKEKIGDIMPSVSPDELLVDPSFGDLPSYVETVIETMKSGLDEKATETFSRLFPGSITAMGRSGVPFVAYGDPSGHRAAIEHAGSGVISLLPLVAGIHRIEAGGVCVLEDPESHLEPRRQLALMDEILRIANENRIGVVVTTQSDFLVQKILSLVSSGRLGQSDVGLYYFRRPENSLTRIERLRVDKTGEAEQEMFTKALDSLIAGFSGRPHDSQGQHSAGSRCKHTALDSKRPKGQKPGRRTPHMDVRLGGQSASRAARKDGHSPRHQVHAARLLDGAS